MRPYKAAQPKLILALSTIVYNRLRAKPHGIIKNSYIEVQIYTKPKLILAVQLRLAVWL